MNRSSPRIKAFAINVAKNEYRREHILAQEKLIGYPVEIFTAVTPDTMKTGTDIYDDQKSRNFTGRSLLPGELACAQSHMALWQDLIDDRAADYYLILEDDIEVRHSMKGAIDQLDLTNIDFLKLSGQVNRPLKEVRRLDGDFRLVRYAYGPLDAAAYVVSKKGAQGLLEYCRPVFTPIDIMMDRSYDHGVTVYGVMPYAAFTEFDFNKDSPLYTDVGIRDQKYADDITL